MSNCDELRKYITINHVQYNCSYCSFQVGTKVVLSKHTNLTHTQKGDKAEDTFKCGECEYQFSAKWNLNNHIRDMHEPTIDCKFFQQGRCQFSKEVCWNRHENKDNQKEITSNVANKNMDKSSKSAKTEECYDCGETFWKKIEMLLHRKNEHPGKVQLCKDPLNCEFKTCAFIHESNFPEGLIQPKPPLNQENVNQE